MNREGDPVKNKILASFRLSPEAKRLLEKLSDKLGISQTAVLEILIRDRAKTERVTIE